MARTPTNWNNYHGNPKNIFSKLFMLDRMWESYRELLKRAKFDHPLSILELGAGTGYIDLRLARTLPTRKITVVDFNRKMLDVARDTLKDLPCKKVFVQDDILNFKSNEKFDLIHSGGVLEHFEDNDRQHALKVHAELLTPGGYCIIYVPTPSSSYKFFRGLCELVDLWPYSDEVPIPKKALVDEMSGTGLEVLATNNFWDYYLTEVGAIARK